MRRVTKLLTRTEVKLIQVRKIPLLIILLISICGARASAGDEISALPVSANKEASTIPLGTVITAGSLESTALESSSLETFAGGPAAEPSNTVAGSFDLSYLFVLSLGVGGLIWIRRQSQSL